MSRRLDVELTSFRNDGTWTWRAAGAKVPKGTVVATLLPTSSKIGDIYKVEADFDIDGITVLSIVTQRDKSLKADFLKLIDDQPFVGVTEKLAHKKTSEKPRRKTDEKRPPRKPRADVAKPARKPRSERKPATPALPVLPVRPVAKRLKPGHKHRSAVLNTIPTEQRSVAELVVSGGLRAVREAIKVQNAQLKANSQPEIKAEGLISMASDILPKLRVAEWLDRAEAVIKDVATIDLRDLRAVVAGADDPMVVRDESTRALASELKATLKARQDQEMTDWLTDLKTALEAKRILRAIKLSGEPPKAGMLFPAELATQIAAAANDALTDSASADLWIAILEALAFSPVRSLVTPRNAPANTTDALRKTVKRLSPLLPQIATIFAIEVSTTAQKPKPLRPPRRKPDFKRKPKSTTVAKTPTEQVQDHTLKV